VKEHHTTIKRRPRRHTRRWFTRVLVTGVIVGCASLPSAASTGSGRGLSKPRTRASVTAGGIIVGVDDHQSTPGHGSTGTSRYTCRYYVDAGGHRGSVAIPKPSLIPGQTYWRQCIERTSGRVSSLRRLTALAPPSDTDTTAQQEFQFPTPEIAHSPVERAFVGIPTYVWLTTPREFSVYKTTLNAMPIFAVGIPTMAILMVSGQEPFGDQLLQCEDPWRPFTPDANVADLCVVMFDAPGTYSVTATVFWDAGYSVQNDSSLDGPVVGRTFTTASFNLVVDELDTTIRRND